MVNQQHLPLAMIQFTNRSYFPSDMEKRKKRRKEEKAIALTSIRPIFAVNYLNILIPSTQLNTHTLFFSTSLVSSFLILILSIVNVCCRFLFFFFLRFFLLVTYCFLDFYVCFFYRRIIIYH